ncbi:MAG: glycosyltransferase [Phycisphaeraceae bacterium]|nr:glycosyltransferase [Phycisphaeraceae bacterium]
MNIDHPIIHVLLWIGSGVVAFHAVYWGAAWYQVVMTMARLPTGMSVAKRLGAGRNGRVGSRVCVVVPAHNEESQIGTIAKSLLQQTHSDLHIVFALDRCTDRTRERLEQVIGADARVTVHFVEHCPDDWAGKPHAMWRAINDTTAARDADFIATVDADTELDPRCIEAALVVMKQRSLDMVSLLSTLTSAAWFERVVQPAATFELMRQYPIRRANATVGNGQKARPARRPFANGQFIMVRREVYFELGGHESVKDQILEDVALSRRFARAGKRTGLLIANGLIRCRMYNSFEEFRLGWNRIYRESVHRNPKRLRSYARRLRTLSVYLPIAVVLTTVLAGVCAMFLQAGTGDGLLRGLLWWNILVGGGGLTAFALLIAVAYRLGQSPWLWAASYPYGSWVVARILDSAAADIESGRPIRWGGRTYYFTAANKA